MTGRIDEIQPVCFSIVGVVLKRHALGLDRNSPLALEIHRIQNLLGHLAIRQSTTPLYETIGKRRLAVIDVSNDRKIADMLHSTDAVNRSRGVYRPNLRQF